MPGLRNPAFRLPPYWPKEVRYRRRAVHALSTACLIINFSFCIRLQVKIDILDKVNYAARCKSIHS